MPRLVGATALVASLCAAARGLELTKENWVDAVAGKTLFLNLHSNVCVWCKHFKPDWDELMDHFEGHETKLVAEVECSGAGRSLCDQLGVHTYPTVIFGAAGHLREYEGNRDLDVLIEFVEGHAPECSPEHLELCDEATKAKIEEFMGISQADRVKLLQEKQASLAASLKQLDTVFETLRESLNKEYEEAVEAKDVEAAEEKKAKIEQLVATFRDLKNQHMPALSVMETVAEVIESSDLGTEVIEPSGSDVLESASAHVEKTGNTEL